MERNEESTRDWDKRIEEGTELDNLEPIEAKTSGKESRSMVFSVRLSPEEMQEIATVAGDRKLGDFMRNAALAAARADKANLALAALLEANDMLQKAIKEAVPNLATQPAIASRGRRRRLA